MAVYDFMKHEKQSFESAVATFTQTTPEFASGRFALEIQYFEVKLDPSTVVLSAGCQVVCIFVNDSANAEVLTLLANQGVKLLTLRCAGFDNVDLKVAHALDIAVTRVPAYSPYAVAEHAAALALSLNRKIVPATARVRQGNFALAGLVGFDFFGKTVGVIGTGKIGQCFIKIMLGFGCKVLCYDAYPSKDVASWDGCEYVDLDTLFAKSRLISLHCPLLPETKHLINKESLAKMQKGVVLINTSRGGLIETQSLIAALKSSHVSAAGPGHHSGSIMEDDAFVRLLSFPNVIVTGHQAFLTEEALEKIANVTLENVRQVCVEERERGKLENRVAPM
ncbi:D-isomer specific 2-hydroxyacid dehydrogenase [Zopfochytrium polystomum]|nr:D-isomer specific 2-hydroxyacid dehydrogenase [Zopfochytrium polystomum]